MRFIYLFIYYAVARYIPSFPSSLLLFRVISQFGESFRVYCVKHIFKKCGEHIYIGHMAYFGSGSNIEIGDYSAIGINCKVTNNIIIGNYVMMGPNCYFLSSNGNHGYEDLSIPMIFQPKIREYERIVIGDDVWFGRDCLIMSGKNIGNHSIIAAGSVVCKDVPEKVVVGGNPIKIIKNR